MRDPSIDWAQIVAALSTPRGWMQLALIAICFGVAWLLHRRFAGAKGDATRSAATDTATAHAGFPLSIAVLLLLARTWMRQSGPTTLLDIALPLVIALVAVRVTVYALRRMFPRATWLGLSEGSAIIAIWVVVALHFTGLLQPIAHALDSAVIPIGDKSVSMLALVNGLVIVLAVLVITLWISGFVEQTVMHTRFDIDLRLLLVKLLRAILFTAGVFIALRLIGFDMTLLTVFGGALGVGIGLGLQKLASNYVSGFAILLERAIRMGDNVTISGRSGIVTGFTARSVVVRDTDGVESIVPNDMVANSVVLRHPPASEVRIAVPAQIALDSDVARAMALMEKAAAANSLVRDGANSPKAVLRCFDHASITLEVGFWVDNTDSVLRQRDDIRSSINQSVLTAFHANGIELA